MKVYLSLILVLLLSITIKTSSANCSYVHIDLDVNPSKNCSSGFAIAKLSKEHSDYNFVWTNLATNIEVTTSVSNLAYWLEAGDYKLTISPKDNPDCKIFKEFFVHGKHHPIWEELDFEGCYEDDYTEVKIGGVMLTIWDDGFWEKEHFGLTSEDELDEDLTWAFRINNPAENAGRWTVVPKPKAITQSGDYMGDISKKINFKRGNTYEFVAVTYGARRLKPFLISKPVKAVTYNASGAGPGNKLANQNSILNRNVSISPQPANDFLNVQLNPNIEVNSYELMNIEGQMFMTNHVPYASENIQIDISSLNSGIYLLKVNSDVEPLTKKIIVR